MCESRPLFSIVVPVYNAGEYFQECMASLFGQTFDDYEIILVDDGSTDTSSSACMEYLREHSPKVRCVSQRNSGQIAARMAGYHMCHGEYVLSVDSDDCLHENTLERLRDVILEYRPDVVEFGMSKSKEFQPRFNRPSLEMDWLLSGESIAAIYEQLATDNWLNSMCSKAIKRDSLPMNIDFSSFSHINKLEDLIQVLPVFERIESYYCMSDNLYFYRPNPNSITHTFYCEEIDQMSMAHNQLLEFSKRGEKRFMGLRLRSRVYSRNLGISVWHMRRACENLLKEEALAEINRVAHMEFFSDSLASRDALRSLRFDCILLAKLAANGCYRMFWHVACVENALSGLVWRARSITELRTKELFIA
ncbi:MAG: glycosyltransferase family 2 protein [Atopobiaceae bacterium]|nr:glycosyltransferase family 2 protein [Atopobiaceae bacterium]